MHGLSNVDGIVSGKVGYIKKQKVLKQIELQLCRLSMMRRVLMLSKRRNGKCAGMRRLPTPGQAIIGVEFPRSLGSGWSYHLLADAGALEDEISNNFIIYLVLSNILIGITLYGSDYKTLESLEMICSCDICHPQLREIFGGNFLFLLDIL